MLLNSIVHLLPISSVIIEENTVDQHLTLHLLLPIIIVQNSVDQHIHPMPFSSVIFVSSAVDRHSPYTYTTLHQLLLNSVDQSFYSMSGTIVRNAYVQRSKLAVALGRKRPELFDSAAVFGRVEQPRLCRCIHHAKRWYAVLDQGDVDGKVAPAVDELFGAIQRVNDQKGLGAHTMCGRLLFGHQGQVRERRAQTCGDMPSCGLIRLGHRACIGLGLNIKVGAAIDLHNQGPRFQCEASECGDHVGTSGIRHSVGLVAGSGLRHPINVTL